ncbi:MAG: hypothetical protein PHN88_16090, partial [Ignavibacteria bacterium]|nr:hypothetical protein [Ignavibacteria bacterium]
MKKLFTTFFVLMITIIGLNSATAQLSGTKTIPGDYATISAAVTALNTSGVGSGGVTFNISAGYIEFTSARLNITATGTSSNQIVFQKSGSGSNPLIKTGYAGTSTPGSATPDGIWSLQGADYVTIDGIDLIDTNTTNPGTMEYGYGLFKNSVTDGSQYNTIKNCTITLNRINNASGTAPMVEGSVCILVVNSLPTAATTALVITASTGSNSFNKFYSNTTQNCNYGIVLYGYADVTPFTLADFGNDIGGSSPGTGNSILNFGGGASTNPAAGVRANNQWGINISYNTVNNNNGSGVNHATTLRGIYAQSGTSANATITYNNVTLKGGATTSSIYAIDNSIGSTAASNTINISYNTITGSYTTATSGSFYAINNGSTAATLNINYNNISGISTPGTGTIYGLYCGSPGVLNASNNTIKTLNKTGIGPIYAIYLSTPFTSSTAQSNTIDSISNTATTNTSTIAGIYSPSSAVIENYNGNIFRNFSSTGTAVIYGIRIGSATGNKTMQNNQIYNLSLTGAGSAYGISMGYGATDDISGNTVYNLSSVAGSLYGIYVTAGTTNSIYNNKVYTFNNTGATGGTIYGLYVSSGTTNNMYKNKIYDLANSTSTSPTIYGAYFGGGTTNNFYNNYVGDLRTPASGNAITLAGIYASAGTYDNLYYNTVYLNAASTGAIFGSSCVYASSSPTLDMRNNILVNLSTPAGATGFTTAYRRTTTTLTTYASTSNNNDFYAGTPGANNLIMFDGTNSYQTILLYKNAVTPRDNFSISENPNFLSTVSSDANYLHINGTTASQIESGGATVTVPSITDDFDGNPRYPNSGYPNNPSYPASAPDIGADEYAGIPIDLNPPVIVYTPLLNTGTLTARTLTATITDASGVPTSGIGLPVLYWKINSGAYSGVTATSLGSNQYSFTFGSGVAVGDTVSYFVAAQDNAPSLNVGSNPTGGSGYTPNPPAASTPPAVPNKYFVTQPALSGDYTVGLTLFNKVTGKNITFEKITKKVTKEVPVYEEGNKQNNGQTKMTGTKKIETEEITWIPMENGKVYAGNLYVKKSDEPNFSYPNGVNGIYATITAAITDLNLRGVSGATRFLLNDASYTTGETFPIVINEFSGASASNTVTIKPNASVTSSISGSSATSIFKINGADYITIDGSNALAGTTKDLTISNTSTAGSVVWIASLGTGLGARKNTIKNSNIVGGAITTGIYGIIAGGTSIGTAGDDNDSLTITNNSVSKAYVGIYVFANSTGLNDNLNITSNSVGAADTSVSLGHDGIMVSNTTGSNISGNTIYNIKVTNTTPAGLTISTGVVSSNINNNWIYNIKYTGTSGYGARGMYVNTGSTACNLSIYNNMIAAIGGDGYTGFSGSSPVGMYFDGTNGGLNIYYNSVYMNGNLTYSAVTLSTAVLFYTTTNTNIDLRNNVFQNSMNNITNSGAKNYAIYSAAPASSFTQINYNDYYVNGTQGILGYLGADITTLSAWAAATGKDGNSVTGDAKFTSNTDLHIVTSQISPVNNAGTYIASVLTDFDGTTRSTTTPDIGADEYTYVPPAVLDPTGVSTATISGSLINLAFTPNVNSNNVVIVWNTTGTFTAPSGTPPSVGTAFAGGTLLYNGTASPQSHSGLTPATTYYYKLFSYDGSMYSTGVTANAATFYGIPYTQDFNSGLTLPAGWTGTMYVSASHGTNSSNGMYYNLYSSATTCNAVTPRMGYVTNQTDLSFDYRIVNYSGYPATATVLGPNDTIKIQVSTDGGSSYSTVGAINSGNHITSVNFVNKKLPLTAYNGSNINIKILGIWGSGDYYIDFDNFAIQNISIPSTPNLVNPLNGTTGSPLNLSLVYNKVLYAYNYNVVLAADAGFTNIILNDSTVTDSLKALTNLTPLTNYYWKVRAGNFLGWGSFSSVNTFKTMGTASQVTLVSPSNNSVDLPVNLSLVWNKAVDLTDGPKAVSGYWLQYSTDGSFATSIIDSTLSDTTKSITGLNTSTTYYWRVKAKNQVGWGAFSTIFHFTTAPNAPNAVTLLAPANNSTGLPVNITFNWSKAIETLDKKINNTVVKKKIQQSDEKNINGKDVEKTKKVEEKNVNVKDVEKDSPLTVSKYWFEYSTDSSFATSSIDTTLTDTTKTINGLNNITRYFWRVKAKNQTGWSSFSSVWNFTTIVAIPVTPVLSSPANGSTGISMTPALTWGAVPYAASYRVQVSSDSLFATSQWDTTGVTGTSNTVPAGKLSQNTKYYWRVNAANAAGTGAWAVKWNFTTLALNLTLNLKVYLEGFWDGTQQVQDTVMIYLASPTT